MSQITIYSLVLLIGALILSGCGSKPAPSLPPDASGTARLSLADHWTLRTPGHAMSLPGTALGRDLLIVHDEDGRYRAFDSHCPHQGCPVSPRAQGDGFECPCHASKFGVDGSVLKGPSPIPLIEYSLTQRGDSLIVDLSDRIIHSDR